MPEQDLYICEVDEAVLIDVCLTEHCFVDCERCVFGADAHEQHRIPDIYDAVRVDIAGELHLRGFRGAGGGDVIRYPWLYLLSVISIGSATVTEPAIILTTRQSPLWLMT